MSRARWKLENSFLHGKIFQPALLLASNMGWPHREFLGFFAQSVEVHILSMGWNHCPALPPCGEQKDELWLNMGSWLARKSYNTEKPQVEIYLFKITIVSRMFCIVYVIDLDWILCAMVAHKMQNAYWIAAFIPLPQSRIKNSFTPLSSPQPCEVGSVENEACPSREINS